MKKNLNEICIYFVLDLPLDKAMNTISKRQFYKEKSEREEKEDKGLINKWS